MSAIPETATLPLNFPQDFVPDRALLSRLLAFAERGGAGTKVEIGAETGIPTGESTGKVEPMIHYARGMGLIVAHKDRGRWALSVTGLGALVFAEDRFLDEAVTLWAMHLMLCRRAGLGSPARGVADPWFALFADGQTRLGNPFDRASLLDLLAERHGPKGYLRSLSGVVPRSYTQAACLGPIGALLEAGKDRYRRVPAPVERSYFPAYTAALFVAWDLLHPGQAQVSLESLLDESRLLAALGWDSAAAEEWIGWMTYRGLVQLDRLTGVAMALRLMATSTVLCGLYEGLA